jgi:hypothetical protein
VCTVALTEKVSLTAVLQKGNRFQVPKVLRWRFKMDTDQVLKVSVSAVEIIGARHVFYARMDRSGRITVPRLTRELVRGIRGSRVGYGLNVTLEPA